MFDLLFEFSRANCISICGFLVPANLLLTSLTMVLVALLRPEVQIRQAVVVACIPALVMVFHVFTWFAVGVVMAPTFILLFLAGICLAINFCAIAYPQIMARFLRSGWFFVVGN